MTGPSFFERHGDEKFVGAIQYAVIIPVLTVFLSAMIGGFLHALITCCGGDADWAGNAMFLLLPSIGGGLTLFAIADYRQRANVNATLHADRVEVTVGRKTRSYAFNDVANVRIVPTWADEACTLEMKDGEQVRLPVEIASFSQIRRAMAATLIHLLMRRMADRIELIDAVELRESSLRGWLRLAHGLFLLLCGMLLCLSIKFAPIGVDLMQKGQRRMRQGWRGTGRGFLADRDGVYELDDGRSLLAEWTTLESCRIDEVGLVLHFRHGLTLSASVFARDYWAFSELVRRYTSLRWQFGVPQYPSRSGTDLAPEAPLESPDKASRPFPRPFPRQFPRQFPDF